MRALHPCLIWMDRRAQDEVEWVRANVDLDRLHAITGNGVDSYYGYTKMMWLRDKRPEVWERTRVPAAEQLRQSRADGRDRGRPQLGRQHRRHLRRARRAWSTEMLAALGMPAALMPARLVDSSEVVGGLLPAWAARLGLRAGLPVVAGGVDAAVATLAAGASRAGNHVAMIGTSMCWGTIRQTSTRGTA